MDKAECSATVVESNEVPILDGPLSGTIVGKASEVVYMKYAKIEVKETNGKSRQTITEYVVNTYDDLPNKVLLEKALKKMRKDKRVERAAAV